MPWPVKRMKNRPPREVTTLTLTPTIDDGQQTSSSSPLTGLSQPFTPGSQLLANFDMSVTGAYDPAYPNFAEFSSNWANQQMYNPAPNGHSLSPTTMQHPQHPQRAHGAQISQAISLSSSSASSASGTSNSDLQTLERLKSEILAGQNPIYKALPQPKFLESLYLGQAQDSLDRNGPSHSDPVSDVSMSDTIGRDGGGTDAISSDVAIGSPGAISGAQKSVPPSAKPEASAELEEMHRQGTLKDTDGHQESTRDSAASSLLKRSGSSEKAETGKGSHVSSQQSAGSLSAKPTMVVSDARYSDSRNGPHGSSFSRDRPYDSRDPTRRSDYNRDIPSDDERAARRLAEYRESRYIESRHFDRDRVRERSRSRDRDRDRRIVDSRLDDRRIITEHPGDRRPAYVDARESRPDPREIKDSRDIRPDPRDVLIKDTRLDARDSRDVRYDRDIRHDPIRPDTRDNRTDSRDVVRGPEYRRNDRMELDRRVIAGPNDRATKPNDDVRIIQADNRREYPPRSRESPPKSTDHTVRPRSPATATSSPEKPTDTRSLADTPTKHTTNDRLAERPRPITGDDRDRDQYEARSRPAVDATPDRPIKPDPALLEERGVPRAPLETRIGDRPAASLEDRIANPGSERAASRQSTALHERISDRPALEERIGNRAALPVDSRAIPAESPRPAASLESRLSQQPNARDRRLSDAGSRTDDRARPASEVGARPDDRRPSSYGAPALPNTRPASARDSRRISPGPPPYRDDRDARFIESRRMDVDTPGRYERPPLPPRDREIPPPLSEDRGRPALDPREWRERSYVPPNDGYSARDERFAPSVTDHREREWSERTYRPPPPPQWDSARPPPSSAHDLDRSRYVERDAPPPSRPTWESPSSQPHDDRCAAAPVPATWERPDESISRGREVYPPPPTDRAPPPAERDYPPTKNYPPLEYNSRVRARSPSPPRRGADDIRPPIKRARDDGPAFYDDPRRISVAGYSSYHPHSRGGSPPPTSGGSYYDSRGPPYTPRDRDAPPYSARERDVRAASDRDVGGGYYERRLPDMPPPRSPTFQGRPIYSRPEGRDERRFSVPPPRTA